MAECTPQATPSRWAHWLARWQVAQVAPGGARRRRCCPARRAAATPRAPPAWQVMHLPSISVAHAVPSRNSCIQQSWQPWSCILHMSGHVLLRRLHTLTSQGEQAHEVFISPGLLLAAGALTAASAPPIMHLRTPNAHVGAALDDWRRTGGAAAALPRQLQPGAGGLSGQLAGTSSFGMSGVNAHALLGEPEAIHTQVHTM